MHKSILITLFLSLLLSACAVHTPAPADTPAMEEAASTESPQAERETNEGPKAISATTIPCPVDLPEDDIEGETVFCGELTVHQNWDDPTGTQITLSYAVFKATGENPSPDPIIYFDGGPGTSTFGQLAWLATKGFGHLRQQHDLIFWDQRGNLYSSNLDCPDEVRDPRTALSPEEFEAMMAAQAETPQPTLDPALLEPTTIYDDPQEVLEKDRALAAYNNLANDPKANCRQYYEEKGVDLTQYSTANSARDVIALMDELDYPEYNLNAISYGTTLALETMRYYDERSDQGLPAVRSVVIDGVSPLTVDMAEQGLIMPYNVLRVFDECEADADCAEAYPDIHQRLLDILATIEKQPLTIDGGEEITLDGLRSLLTFGSSSDPASLVYLPRLIDELERGETAVYELMQARTGAVAEEVPGGIEAIDILTPDAKDAILCNDRSANLDVDRAFDLYRSFEAPQLITDSITVVQQIVTCEAWGIMNESASLPDPVTSGLHTLVSNGAMDSATAVEWGEMAYKHLPNAELVVFPFAPHAASVRSECGKVVTKAYFADPRAESDLTCVEATRPVFVLPDDALPAVIEDDSEETTPSPATPDASGDLSEETVTMLDEFLKNLVYTEGADPASAAPGLVLLVDTPDGHYLNAAGVASMEESTPMKPDDHLEIGSNTKSFTIVLLMQLQEEGVLFLDDPLSKWLPDWAEKIPNGDQMTLHQLAQHTTGIWDYGDPIIGAGTEDPDKLVQGYTPEELVQYAIDNGTPDFAPGEEGMWNYSNTGYILLGMVIEKAAGKSLGDLYQERIFDPLGMETAVFIEGVPKDEEITTNGYWWNDDGTVLNTTNWNASQGWAAGALAMNAEDLLTYAKALSVGELFQDPDSLTQMLTFDPNGMDGMMPYGLGLIDFSKVGAEGYWGHEGQTAGFQSLWYTNPDTGTTVVGLSNSAAFQAYAFLKALSLLSPAQ